MSTISNCRVCLKRGPCESSDKTEFPIYLIKFFTAILKLESDPKTSEIISLCTPCLKNLNSIFDFNKRCYEVEKCILEEIATEINIAMFVAMEALNGTDNYEQFQNVYNRLSEMYDL